MADYICLASRIHCYIPIKQILVLSKTIYVSVCIIRKLPKISPKLTRLNYLEESKLILSEKMMHFYFKKKKINIKSKQTNKKNPTKVKGQQQQQQKTIAM